LGGGEGGLKEKNGSIPNLTISIGEHFLPLLKPNHHFGYSKGEKKKRGLCTKGGEIRERNKSEFTPN